MYNPNYGYSPSSSHQQPTSLPFQSTPSNVRPTRPPRFGYPGPAAYPRPRSSASKPNPEGYPESPREDDFANSYQFNYPNSESYTGSPMRNINRNTSEGYINSPMQSIYDNRMNTPSRASFGNSDAYVNNLRASTDSMVNNYSNTSMNLNDSSHSENTTAYFTCNESFYESPKKPLLLGNSPVLPLQYSPSKFPLKNSGLEVDNRPNFQRQFQNKKDKFKANSSYPIKPNPYANRRRGKKPMASKGEWRCSICNIEFTSGIPYDMHLRGAKHAKKMKSQDALHLIQSQVAQNKEIAPVGKLFRCELCNITANSTLQLQTHLDGTKHKNKLQLQQQPKDKKTEKESEPEVNGKSNGAAVVRPLPTEFGEPQQAKMCKFSCDTCNIIVNSEIQLQQHLTSKKHQAKVEGKPYKKAKRKKDGDENEETEHKTDDNAMETEQKQGDGATESNVARATTSQDANNDSSKAKTETSNTGEARKMVVGVKTLSSSFVQGDTLL